MAESVYIHIPFCKSKCKYCSFVSYTDTCMAEDYVKALTSDILHYYGGEFVDTIYFGGGTPSVLNVHCIDKILQLFNINSNHEITFEFNPDDTNKEYLRNLRACGINRLSIGAQTFNDNILDLIGRRHNSKQIFNALNTAYSSGFDNISIDLMYGLPFQTEESLRNDLKIISSLEINHVSTYGLKIEPLSYFYSNKPEKLPDGDTQADMYLMINDFMKNNGFIRYEISNYTKCGYESKHNLNYWNNGEYYGFGVSAHGYKDGVRYSCKNDLTDYLSNPLIHHEEHIVTYKERLEEEIFLGFRRANGLNVPDINKKFKIDFDTKYKNILDKYLKDYIERTPDGYCLTTNGILLSNIILADFLD